MVVDPIRLQALRLGFDRPHKATRGRWLPVLGWLIFLLALVACSYLAGADHAVAVSARNGHAASRKSDPCGGDSR
jgi:hypothetical protein